MGVGGYCRLVDLPDPIPEQVCSTAPLRLYQEGEGGRLLLFLLRLRR